MLLCIGFLSLFHGSSKIILSIARRYTRKKGRAKEKGKDPTKEETNADYFLLKVLCR